ncbi:MAG: phosphatase PAP2 family protein [Bryobacteraceae bacterium]|jgi:membrane-associated phospholipid phosphatase
MRLRASEWLLVVYFAYVATLCFFFPGRPHLGYKPLYGLGLAGLPIVVVAYLDERHAGNWIDMFRDWTPLAFTLVAFREMDWFTPARYTLERERVWLQQDHWLLTRLGLARAVEVLGPVGPGYLEVCYLLVYATGAFCVLTLWLAHRRPAVDRWMVVYLAGTLLSYALFPFFPSLPPRSLMHPAVVVTWFRRCNLWLLDSATIHSAVFPSAHVSSVFSAAWGLFAVLPTRPAFGWGMLFYACSVSVATIYGGYHYTADVLAGFALSLVAAAVAFALRDPA